MPRFREPEMTDLDVIVELYTMGDIRDDDELRQALDANGYGEEEFKDITAPYKTIVVKP